MKKLLAIVVLGLLWCNIGYSEIIHIKCLQTVEGKPSLWKKGKKYFEYFTINPEKGYARNDAWGIEREMEKNSKVHEMTKLDGKFFIWGNSYIDENNINFYHFYQIDLKTLRKKGKAKMAYVSNLVVGLDGMVREKRNTRWL